MPVSSVTSDLPTLTLTAVGEYPVPVERLWAAWMDPRLLERFWGPPQWPATFTRLEAYEGGRADYHMSGPGGETSHGYWQFTRVAPGVSFEVLDGFAFADGTPNRDIPETRMSVRFEPTATGSRFMAVSTFASAAAMEQLLAMGMVEGLSAALSQMDAVLEDLRAFSATLSTALEVIDDTHVVVTRDIRGTLLQVWNAHQEPELLQRWLLGPPGWSMPVCVVARAVGDVYRYEWESQADGSRFGFTGELVALEPPRRAVTTERMADTEGPHTENELVLTPRPGGLTRLELRITYPSRELRDMILGTGMVDGMETSYARLETVLG